MEFMKLGKLDFEPVEEHTDWVAGPVEKAIEKYRIKGVLVSRNDAALSDTAAYCAYYEISAALAANCVIVEAKRGERVWYAACLVLAIDRADINAVVRRHLEARKISFASMEHAVQATGMEFGGITPIGLPEDWPILVDEAVVATDRVILGSGIRGSKLLVPGKLLAELPGAMVLSLAKPKAA